eukprot:TRINITY_DN12348_c0_g1_i1.p1 TRINITY_DN12348_c0_g1~~TRINITY_DN12348_c0_g1_i1.p1  ORF type:complete len:356 (+),score=92.54 TRINITY_DN12348_c0_g1_i1:78-1145(+)
MADWSKFSKLTGDDEKVVLAGDSVLDNFYWLVDKRKNLRAVVEECLKQSERTKHMVCLNMAVDQMSSFDFILRRPSENGWHQYQYEREKVHKNHPSDDALDRDGYRHLMNAEGNIESVENIARLKNAKYVFLSVGGNDVYLHADIQIGLGKSLLPGCDKRSRIASAYGERLTDIVSHLKRRVPGAEIIPVVVYHPHHDFPISGITGGCLGGLSRCIQKNYLSWMVTPMVQQVLKIAEAEKLRVIDLSQTFDPNDSRHYGNMDPSGVYGYGWSGAEPSDISQNFIAALMQHVIENPTATPTIYHATTQGDSLKKIHARPITRTVVDTYKFHHGPDDEKESDKTAETKKCKKKASSA